MLRRHRAIAAAALIALLPLSVLSACATEVTGTATAGKIPTSSSATEESVDASAEESAEDSATVEEPDSGDGPIPPVEPDADPTESGTDADGPTGQTAAWFGAFCAGFDDLTSYSSPDVTGMSDEAALQTIVDAYTAMSQIAVGTADELIVMTPPNFPESETITTAVTDWFYTVGDVYAAGASAIANGTFEDGDALADQIDAIEAGLDGVNASLGSAMDLLDAGTKQLMGDLPECASLVGG